MEDLTQHLEKDAVTKIAALFWINSYSTHRQCHFCPVPLKLSHLILSCERNLVLEEFELMIYSSFFHVES